ncbi:hypothetical protein M569_06756, partial [Genlisea aurea]
CFMFVDEDELASWLGASYIEDASRLNMAEVADRKFTRDLVSLVNDIRDAADAHQLLTKSGQNPAELIIGRFDGIKGLGNALQDHYGREGISQLGLDVLASAITKAFTSLESAYGGKIVG